MAGVLTVVATLYPKPGKEDEVRAILARMADGVRKAEPKCIVYRPHRLEGNPPDVLFDEQYRPYAAFEFHKTAPHPAGHRTDMKGVLARASDIELYRSLTD